MATHKIVLFYRFTPLPDPEAVRLWQDALARRWSLVGRVVVSPQGINATLGGTVQDLKRYLTTTRSYPGFADVDVKWADGTGRDFPRLSVRTRPELVGFGVPERVEVDAGGVVAGGRRVDPQGLHRLVAERGEDVVMFDGRNAVEAGIGRFRGAVVTQARTSKDIVAELDAGRYDHLRDRPVVTYCTGGVRCEVISSLMLARGFREVYQLDGGIVRYGEAFGNDGLWEGSLHVFDGRGRVELAPGAAVLGRCEACGAPTAEQRNCADPGCRTLSLRCDACAAADPAHVCAGCAVPGAAADARF